jgi:hypothetical protein
VLDPVTEGAMQPALDVQSTFLNTSCSTTAGYPPYSYRHILKQVGKTILQKITASLSSRRDRQRIGAQDNVPDDFSPNADIEA